LIKLKEINPKNRSADNVKKEKREFYIHFYKSREKHQNFKNPSKIKGYR
jgi:hypothetical protein